MKITNKMFDVRAFMISKCFDYNIKIKQLYDSAKQINIYF